MSHEEQMEQARIKYFRNNFTEETALSALAILVRDLEINSFGQKYGKVFIKEYRQAVCALLLESADEFKVNVQFIPAGLLLAQNVRDINSEMLALYKNCVAVGCSNSTKYAFLTVEDLIIRVIAQIQTSVSD